MPIFEYKCAHCNKVFEVLLLHGRAHNEIMCPKCNGRDLEKLISAPFLPSSVGKPANDDISTPCCGNNPGEKGCQPGSRCPKEAD